MADQREPTVLRILGVAVALEILPFLYISSVGADLNRFVEGQPQVFWLVLDLVLLWLVARGSPVARWTLVAVTGLPLLIAATTMFPPTWYLGGLVAIGVGELVCLLSPPVRRHTSRGAGRAPLSPDRARSRSHRRVALLLTEDPHGATAELRLATELGVEVATYAAFQAPRFTISARGDRATVQRPSMGGRARTLTGCG